MKKIFLTFCMVGIALFILGGCGNSDQNEQQNTSAGEEASDVLENGIGMSSVISIEDAFYYDLLEDDAGDIVAVTGNTSQNASKDAHVIAWKSSDRGDTWEALLYQPDVLADDSEIQAGGLRIGKEGIEAVAVFSDHAGETESARRLYRITENTCEELDANEVFDQLGSTVWNISFVNDHIISIAGGEQCILYDIDTQKSVKSLSYDSFTVGFLPMQEQFLIYGKEIVYCLDAETLEEQEAEEGLQEFVAAMYEKNDSIAWPPLDTYKDAVICVTTDAVYEYREGKTVQALLVPAAANGENFFNGMLPMCKGKNNTYYVCAFGAGRSDLLRLEEDKGAEREVFTIYSLTKNEDIGQVAMLFQQEHPELKVEIRVGMEDEAALTRTDVIKQLNTELLSGGGPDIIIMDGLSVEKYADMGLLLPIEQEQPEDKYFKNIIETYQKEDTLYAVPIGFWLYAVQGTEDMSSEITSPSDMCQWILSNEDKAGLDGYEYSYGYNTYSQYAQFIYDTYANSIVRNGTADRKALEAYMSVCGKLAEASDPGLLDDEYVTYSILPGTVEIRYNDEVKISAGTVGGMTELAALTTERENETAEYSLYPMYQPCDIIAINANTEHADKAQDFAEFSLGDSVQKMNIRYLLPVTLETFHSAAKGEGTGADPDGLLEEILFDGEEESFLIYCPNDDEIASLEQEIKEIDNAFTDDVIIRDIVMEALESYLSGTVTLEDAVSSARNKINLYLGE